MNNIEEFLSEELSKLPTYVKYEFTKLSNVADKALYDSHISFAKMHVKAALEAAAENAWLEDGCDTHGVEIDKDTIINAYPLTNIK